MTPTTIEPVLIAATLSHVKRSPQKETLNTVLIVSVVKTVKALVSNMLAAFNLLSFGKLNNDPKLEPIAGPRTHPGQTIFSLLFKKLFSYFFIRFSIFYTG